MDTWAKASKPVERERAQWACGIQRRSNPFTRLFDRLGSLIALSMQECLRGIRERLAQ